MTDSSCKVQVMTTAGVQKTLKVSAENGLPSPENHYPLYEDGDKLDKNEEEYSENDKADFSTEMRECSMVPAEELGVPNTGNVEKAFHTSVVISLSDALPAATLTESDLTEMKMPFEDHHESVESQASESVIRMENGDDVNENEQTTTGAFSEEIPCHMDHLQQNERLEDYSEELRKDESNRKEISRSAAVICMGTSSAMYAIPEGKGLPPVSTIIRSTARFDRTTILSSLGGETHLPSMASHHTSVVNSPVQVPCSSPSRDLCSMRNMERFSPHRSVVVTTASQGLSHVGYPLPMNSEMEMTAEEDSRLSYAVTSSLPSHYVQQHVLHSPMSDLSPIVHVQMSKEVCNNIKLRMAHDDCPPQPLNYNHSDLRKELENEYILHERHLNETDCSDQHHHQQQQKEEYAGYDDSCMPTSDLTREQNAINVLSSIIRRRPHMLTREPAFDHDSDHILVGEMDSSPSNLIMSQSERVGRMTMSASFSGDDTSDEESPMISMDSDMETKVQDLTRHHHHHHHGGAEMDEGEVQNELSPMDENEMRRIHQEVHGMPTGVIMSTVMQSAAQAIEESDPRDDQMADEAEDLSHRSKVPSDLDIGGTRNSQSDDDLRTCSPTTTSLSIVSTTMLPSFLSVSSQALLSMSGLPLTLPTSSPLPYVPPSQSGLVSGPIPSAPPIVLSNSSANLPCIKQEPVDPTENSACINSTVVTTCTNTSNSIINNNTVAAMLRLPSLSNLSPFFAKHEHLTSGSHPPFQVISALKKDLINSNNNQLVAHASSSSPCNFPQSTVRGSLVVSGVHLPSMNIPNSPMSDTSETSPLAASVPSHVAPTSSKKTDKSGMVLQSSVIDSKKWCCPMCRNGSPCGLHPTQTHVVQSGGAPLSGDPSKPYQCNICGKHLASKNVYQLHMRAHSGEKPFKCNLCGHHFSQKTSLTRHMRSHTGERPFPCGVCGKRFADKERIKIHMRTHTGEKPFPCDVCGKRFSQKSTVKRHMSVHTGEKPFKCEACGKGFANRGNLNAHAKTHANS